MNVNNTSLEDGGAMEVAEANGSGDGLVAVEGQALGADEDAGEETRRPRICRRPIAPTKDMVEEHNPQREIVALFLSSCGFLTCAPGV